MFKTATFSDFALRSNSWVHSLFQVVAGSFLIALFARISLPLPFSPVPIAFAGQSCLLLGVLLGRRCGTLAVLTYIVQGLMGLPVFALGRAGIGVLLGPTGGYLIGYLLGAWIAGHLVERSSWQNFRGAMLAMIAGTLAIYLCGLPQLSLFVGIERVFYAGMLPFLIGDTFKIFVSYHLLKRLGFRRSGIDR